MAKARGPLVGVAHAPRRVEMDRGTAMPAVVLDVYKGGKDLIPGGTLSTPGA